MSIFEIRFFTQYRIKEKSDFFFDINKDSNNFFENNYDFRDEINDTKFENNNINFVLFRINNSSNFDEFYQNTKMQNDMNIDIFDIDFIKLFNDSQIFFILSQTEIDNKFVFRFSTKLYLFDIENFIRETEVQNEIEFTFNSTESHLSNNKNIIQTTKFDQNEIIIFTLSRTSIIDNSIVFVVREFVSKNTF